ncbi:MAG TPA: metallophosphoesterase family protein [Thermomicrobiales bacterium]|nr:metallophosphoesterase family protein [Thermomicrobiales bacterium]
MNLPRSRRPLAFLLVLVLIFLPGVAVVATLGANQLGYCVNAILPGGDSLNARPYLLQVGSDSATLRLRSTVSAEAILTYGPEGGSETTTTLPASKLQTTELSDLRPGTTYTYTVTRGEHTWDGAFRTSSGVDDTVQFDVLGSSGVANDVQHAIAAEMVADAPDFVLHTGDVVYPRGALCHYGLRYFGPYEDLIGNSPVAPAVGEIDLKANNGKAFREAFELPADPDQENPLYRSFDYGPVHVVILDSELYEHDDRAGIDAQRDWLTSDLQAADLPWTVVVIHRPLYSSTKGAASDEIAQDLGPIFQDNGVDLVLSGHARNYERFQPDDGITYVVSGGGGAGTQGFGANRTSVAAAEVHHFLSIEASPDALSARVIDDHGTVIDTFTLTASS